MKKCKLMLVAVAAGLLGASAGAARADTVTFTLTGPNQAGGAGQTLTYYATVMAAAGNSANGYLNGDSFNFSGPGMLDDTGFFANFPLYLTPGQSFTGDLFSVVLPAGAPIGTYMGSFSLLGGPSGSSYSVLGTQNFSVNVTPEPSSLLLLGTGVSTLFAAYRRKRGVAV